jgi:hypothetical protein
MQAKKLLTAFAAAAVFTVSAGIANADVWNKKTRLTVNETIEVPGATLPPGEYVVKLVDSQSNRHIVQFMNAEEDEVLSTVIAIPNSRLEPTGDTEFEWYETPAGQPPALRAWFYPGDNFGQEFAYPEDRAATLAQQTSQEVPSATAEQREEIAALPEEPAQAEPAEQPEPQVEEERPLVVEREPTVIAQAQPPPEPEPTPQPEARPQPAPQPQPDVTQERETETELPETAGFGPLLMLIGLGALGASAAVRKVRKS